MTSQLIHSAGRGALQAAHRATLIEFFVLGIAAAALGVHVPSIKSQYGLDEGTLSLALLSAASGGVLCLMVAGRIIARFGARYTTLVAGLVLSAALALLLAFDRLPVLVALMAVFGAAAGLFDVAINAEGTYLEEHLGRKIVSTLHGLWSLGGMAGSAAGAALLRAGMAPFAQLQLAAFCVAAVSALATLAMLSEHAQTPQPTAALPPTRARGLLILLGLLAALGMMAEGALYDWSVLYVHTDLGASPALAALAYTSFSAAMAATRFVGDWLRARIAPLQLLGGSAALSAVAMVLVLLWGEPWAAVLGFGLVGMGMANVVPILYVEGSRVPGVPSATGIALVSSLGYFGMVAGPPLVGGIAQISSLSVGLSVVIVAALLLAAGALRLRVKAAAAA